MPLSVSRKFFFFTCCVLSLSYWIIVYQKLDHIGIIASMSNIFSQFNISKSYFDWHRSNASSPRSERHHIVFVKVHKAASSTVQNILLRLAMSRNLNVLLMKKGNHINETGTFIDPSKHIDHPEGKKFDILTNHIVFDYDEIARYFPKSTVYVGIVRRPLRQFISAFAYYAFVWKVPYLIKCIQDNPKDPIGHFLRHPLQYSPANPRQSFVNNRMSVDFGFPPKTFEKAKKNKTKVREFVGQIHKTFDLILISNKFDESLVLLRRFMNWKMKDILYKSQNVFGQKSKTTWIFRKNYSKEDLIRFSEWAAMDIILYKDSLKIFMDKIKREHKFEEEMKVFRDIRRKVEAFCRWRKTQGSRKFPLVIEKNEWTDQFKIGKEDCYQMNLNEKFIVDLVRRVQLKRIKGSRQKKDYKHGPSRLQKKGMKNIGTTVIGTIV